MCGLDSLPCRGFYSSAFLPSKHSLCCLTWPCFLSEQHLEISLKLYQGCISPVRGAGSPAAAGGTRAFPEACQHRHSVGTLAPLTGVHQAVRWLPCCCGFWTRPEDKQWQVSTSLTATKLSGKGAGTERGQNSMTAGPPHIMLALGFLERTTQQGDMTGSHHRASDAYTPVFFLTAVTSLLCEPG